MPAIATVSWEIFPPTRANCSVTLSGSGHCNHLPCIGRGGGPAKLVEGQLTWRARFAFFDDGEDDPFKIVPNVQSPKPQGLDPLPRHQFVPTCVAWRIRTKLMRDPVDLYGQRCLETEKVEDKRSGRMLSPELEAVGLALEGVPKTPLRWSHRPTQTARADRAHLKSPSTILRMVPLPSKTRGGKTFTRTRRSPDRLRGCRPPWRASP